MRRPPSEPRRIRSGEAGFSLLETLIAAAMLLLILIGILPLFERSRLNIVQGGEMNRSANAVVDASERMLSLPFDNFSKIIVAAESRIDTDFWLIDGDTWSATVPTGDHAQLTRQLTVEQFNSAAIEDDDWLIGFEGPSIGEENEAEPAGAARENIHLKRFHLRMTAPRNEGGPGFTVLTVQAY
jgi:Tfp pilus assembly protein PilV